MKEKEETSVDSCHMLLWALIIYSIGHSLKMFENTLFWIPNGFAFDIQKMKFYFVDLLQNVSTDVSEDLKKSYFNRIPLHVIFMSENVFLSQSQGYCYSQCYKGSSSIQRKAKEGILYFHYLMVCFW